ncbi:hypothetical protein [Chitinibacter tainanensis]|uniref:hypothetical protein n=1 Tax=Chitinibacter tainanensis TaxID=230667 RepID=UPI00041D6C5D|nr:hypothetical protein [Chitinibacter tainanensis]
MRTWLDKLLAGDDEPLQGPQTVAPVRPARDPWGDERAVDVRELSREEFVAQLCRLMARLAPDCPLRACYERMLLQLRPLAQASVKPPLTLVPLD